MLLRKILLFSLLTLAPLLSVAAPTNTAFFKKELLGKSYCYKNSPNSGWIFTDDQKAIKHAVNIGRPSPNDIYELKYFNRPRTYGNFQLVNSFQSLNFILYVSHFGQSEMYEYSTGLSLRKCDQPTSQKFQMDVHQCKVLPQNDCSKSPKRLCCHCISGQLECS